MEIVNKSVETEISGSFNISSGQPTTVKDLYHAVNKALNLKGPTNIKELPTSDDDLKRLVLNPSKAEEAFGMKFTYELELWVKVVLIGINVLKNLQHVLTFNLLLIKILISGRYT